MNDFTIVYVLGGAVLFFAGMYYLARYAQSRQQPKPAVPIDWIQTAGQVYVAGIVWKFVAYVIIGIVLLAFFLWPR